MMKKSLKLFLTISLCYCLKAQGGALKPIQESLQEEDQSGANELLFDSAQEGNISGINDALKAGADIEARVYIANGIYEEVNALHLAAMKGNEKAFIALLAAGAKIDAIASDGKTVLHIASQYEKPSIIKALLKKIPTDDKDVFINIQDKYGNTALHVAALHGSIQAIKRILKEPDCDHDALLKNQNFAKKTALHIAADVNKVEIMKALLKTPTRDKDVVLNVQDDNGETMVHIATTKANVEMIKIILATPKINLYTLLTVQDIKGETALHVAAAKDLTEIVNLLINAHGLNKKAFINIKDNMGQTSLHKAAANCRMRTAYELLAAGADSTITDNDGKTSADVAKCYRNKVLASALTHMLNQHAEKLEAERQAMQIQNKGRSGSISERMVRWLSFHFKKGAQISPEPELD